VATLSIPCREHPPNWQTLLSEALAKPGLVSEAYSRFHNFSIGTPNPRRVQPSVPALLNLVGPITSRAGAVSERD
jgi:hypothetical protein